MLQFAISVFVLRETEDILKLLLHLHSTLHGYLSSLSIDLLLKLDPIMNTCIGVRLKIMRHLKNIACRLLIIRIHSDKNFLKRSGKTSSTELFSFSSLINSYDWLIQQGKYCVSEIHLFKKDFLVQPCEHGISWLIQ